jgi:hypothetical protein
MVEPYSKMEVTMWGIGRMIRSADGAQHIELIRKLVCMSKKKVFGTIMAN